MRDRTIVDEYLDYFCRGNIDGIESTLAEDFKLRGPLFEFGSRDAYIRSLRETTLDVASIRIIEFFQNDDCIAVFYEYEKPSGSNTVAQLFWIRENVIVETLLVFDGSSVD